MDLDRVDFGFLTQAEVQAQIVLGEVTGAAAHFIELGQLPGLHRHPRADRSAVALGADQPEHHAMIAGNAVIQQQRRRFADVEQQDVHVAVVIHVAKGRTAA